MPDLSNLPEWETKTFVLKEDSNKLEPKTEEGRWMGYSNESKGHRIYWPGKHCITIERNVMLDAPILVTPDNTLPTTESNQGISGTACSQPGPAPVIEIMHTDPLEGFEAVDPTDQPQGRGHRAWKPSAYICEIADGTFSSTSHANAPTYSRGLPMPSNNSALVTLTESEDEGDLQCSPGIAMEASKCDAGTDPTNLNDAHSCEDWPQWDMSI